MARYDLVLLHAPSVYDFREEPILYGPVSDVVPSLPVFEMYPVGFSSLASYLEARGFRVRIVNLAVRMLKDPAFQVEEALAGLDTRAWGLDLHWLCHAQGSLEVARLAKALKPGVPIIFGGLSASYYHRELMGYPQVDYVLRGDSTEGPLAQLLEAIKEGDNPEGVPNLTWRDAQGQVRVNPLENVPADLSGLELGYGQIVRSVVRDRDLLGYVPFGGWLDYPIMAAITCRGCTHFCVPCGGSAFAFGHFLGRSHPAFRPPEVLAEDIRQMKRISRGPVFILGDIRQAGEDYAERFLAAAQGIPGPVMLEFFAPPPREFLLRIARTFPDHSLELSMESHDPQVRHAFGRRYTNEAAEEAIAAALDLGCRRFDLFFMVGLPRQDYASVMGTVDYCGELLTRFGAEKRFAPFISPLAPFLDPGSLAYEKPEEHGYRLFHRTLEEHRRALLAPSWKYTLNYETRWMTRDEIVAATYEAGLRLNRLKAHYGLISSEVAAEVEDRILRARRLIGVIDDIMKLPDEAEKRRSLLALKPQLDAASAGTVCGKKELDLPLGWQKFNLLGSAKFLLREWGGRLRPSRPRGPKGVG